jgi:hypothetical protein
MLPGVRRIVAPVCLVSVTLPGALECAAMSGQNGTIVELDPIDALGWIELDEGGRVRFGGTALEGFTTNTPRPLPR